MLSIFLLRASLEQLLILEEENKSSNDGNSADSEGGEESELGDKSLGETTIRLHLQPNHGRPKDCDPNRLYVNIALSSL